MGLCNRALSLPPALQERNATVLSIELFLVISKNRASSGSCLELFKLNKGPSGLK